MQGFHPAKHKAKPKNYANGGIVKGPGTGTSDDVPAMVPEDGYIMPADSTQALGFKPGMRQVQLSNGEAVLNGAQVQQAGGVQALEQMKAATHMPVPEKGALEEPQFFFANGGPLDEDKRKPFMPVLPQDLQNGMTKMYSTGMPTPGAGRMAPGAGRGFAVPTSPPVTRERDVRQAQMAAEAGQREAAQAATNARYADTGAQEAAAARAAFSAKIGNSAIRPYRDPAAAVAPPAAAVSPAPAVQPPAQAVGFPAQRPAAPPAIVPPAPASVAAPGAPTAQPTAQPVAPAPTGNVNVQRQANGVMSFSGENVTGDVSYNGAQAAGFKPRGAGVSVVPSAPGLGFQPTQQASAPVTPAPAVIPQDTGGFGLLDRGARERRNAMIDVQQGDRGARTALAGLLNQQAAEPGRQLDREKMAADVAAGSADRALKAEELGIERGFRSGQLANDSARTNVESQKAASEIEARGFEVGQAKRMQKLQDDYINADTDEKRAAAAKKLQTLSGKQDQANRFTVVPGGQEWDDTAKVMRTVPSRVLNNQTEQFVDGGQGGQKSQPPENHIAALKADPKMAAKFDEWYGAGASQQYLAAQ